MPKASTPVPSRRKLILWLCSAAGGLLLVAGILTWILRPASLPAPGGLKPAALGQLLASDDFARLSDQQKIPYAKALLALNPHDAGALFASLSPTGRNTLLERMGYTLLLRSADGYFNIEGPVRKTAYIDHLLDWYHAVKLVQGQQAEAVKVSQAESSELTAGQHVMAQKWLEHAGPSQSARMGEFWKAMMMRYTFRSLVGHGR
jgi:hypothetical protein